MARSVRFKLPAGMQTRAAVAPSTFDPEKGTVEVVFTTGARGKRYSFWDGPFYEELEVSEAAVDMSRLNNGAPVLAAHNQYGLDGVIGVVERAWLVGSEGRALLRLSEREEVKPIRADIQAGILRHLSVGYSIQKMEKVEEVEDVPVYRVTRWTPSEISFVPMGFDDHATVRGAEKQDFYEVEIATQERHMKQPQTPVAPAAPAEPVASPTTSPAATTTTAPAEENRAALEEAAKLTERQRCTDIRSVVTRAKLGDELADKLISDGVSIDEARKVVLNKLADADEQIRTENHVRVEVGDDASDKFARAAEASILERAGVLPMLERASKTPAGRSLSFSMDPGNFRGWKLEHLAAEVLERNGMKTRGMTTERIFSEAFHVRGANSSSDFPVLLESAMNKTLLGSFATQQITWPQFCARLLVPDFRSANFYRNGSFGTLDKVNEAGEFKNKPIPDGEKSSIAVESYGNIIAITRKALINDDLGAFMDLAARFGASAGRTVEAAVYALLAQNGGLGPTMPDGHPLFDAAHRNIGSAATISVDSVDADAALMATQKDPSNNDFLDLRPAVLLVPRGLQGTALGINNSEFEPTSNKLQIPNRCLGMFREVVGTARLTGTRRYSFAEAAAARVLAVAFLAGHEAPEVFTEEGWRVDGTELKVRLDFGVSAMDYRGAVTNAGTP